MILSSRYPSPFHSLYHPPRSSHSRHRSHPAKPAIGHPAATAAPARGQSDGSAPSRSRWLLVVTSTETGMRNVAIAAITAVILAGCTAPPSSTPVEMTQTGAEPAAKCLKRLISMTFWDYCTRLHLRSKIFKMYLLGRDNCTLICLKHSRAVPNKVALCQNRRFHIRFMFPSK